MHPEYFKQTKSTIVNINTPYRPFKKQKKNWVRPRRSPRAHGGFLDAFGHVLFLKGILMSIIGALTYRRFNVINEMHVSGMEHLDELPEKNVIFVSNHQTYYSDVIALYHVFCAYKWNQINIDRPVYLLNPKVRSYFVAAEETMKDAGWLPKLFAYAGAVMVKRTWRHKDKSVNRDLDIDGIINVRKALKSGWLINFPQGTTKKNAPIRKGAAQIIKDECPIVVPVKISGFREAFDKTGLKIQKRNQKLSISFFEPRIFDSTSDLDEIYRFLEHITREED